LELFRHVAIILCPCVHHSEDGHMSGRNMTVTTVQKSYFNSPFKSHCLRDAPAHYYSTTVRSAHTVFMCFVFIWEQTAKCAIYCINWLVSITSKKSVYSAVRTGSLTL